MKKEVSAFISSSIRDQDSMFFNLVVNELSNRGIKPFGTVGKLHVSPNPVPESIHSNIEAADLFVVCLTPRYSTTDIHNSTRGFSGSEVVQNEIGMAYSMNKPIIAFVQQGCTTGDLLKGTTQYIVLENSMDSFKAKQTEINSLIENSMKQAGLNANTKANQELWSLAVGAFAIFGFINLFSEE